MRDTQALRSGADDIPGGDKLNPAQRLAAGSGDGPLLIIAGAGIGQDQDAGAPGGAR